MQIHFPQLWFNHKKCFFLISLYQTIFHTVLQVKRPLEERLDQNYIKQYFLHKKQAHGWDCSNGAECAYLGPGFDVSVVGWWLGGEPDQPAPGSSGAAQDL